MSFTIQELASHLGASLLGDGSAVLSDVASLSQATAQHLSYVESRKHVKSVTKSPAGALITSPDLVDALTSTQIPLLVVPTPQKSFIQAMLLFRSAPAAWASGISDRAIISPTATIGKDCAIGPNAIIGENVVIGDRCVIGPGAVISESCRLGADCQIAANAVLYARSELRDRVIVHANAVIGGDGFGYRMEQGAFVKIPHTGIVILEEDVEVGACSTIDRGMIEATIIGRGTKIDNQVMIAHNCQIGRNNIFASQVGLAGSVSTGEYVMMGGKTGIADHIHIGTGVKLGGNSGVLSDITEPGAYYDSPAVPEKEALRNHVNIRRLPEMREQIKQLSQQLAQLQEQILDLQKSASTNAAA